MKTLSDILELRLVDDDTSVIRACIENNVSVYKDDIDTLVDFFDEFDEPIAMALYVFIYLGGGKNK